MRPSRDTLVGFGGAGAILLASVALLSTPAFETTPTPTPTVTVTAPPATVKVTVPGPVRTVTVTRASRSEVRIPPPTAPSPVRRVGAVQAYARSLVPAAQWPCLRELWRRESNWRWNADNPTSSAYGIPQALPGSKMRAAGADWRTNPRTQIRWGLRYIDARYGTACAALAHHDRKGWY